MKLETITNIQVVGNKVLNNLRGIKITDCGINGNGFITRNVSAQNIDAGIFHRSVMLLCAYDDPREGTWATMLNRPSGPPFPLMDSAARTALWPARNLCVASSSLLQPHETKGPVSLGHTPLPPDSHYSTHTKKQI